MFRLTLHSDYHKVPAHISRLLIFLNLGFLRQAQDDFGLLVVGCQLMGFDCLFLDHRFYQESLFLFVLLHHIRPHQNSHVGTWL